MKPRDLKRSNQLKGGYLPDFTAGTSLAQTKLPFNSCLSLLIHSNSIPPFSDEQKRQTKQAMIQPPAFSAYAPSCLVFASSVRQNGRVATPKSSCFLSNQKIFSLAQTKTRFGFPIRLFCPIERVFYKNATKNNCTAHAKVSKTQALLTNNRGERCRYVRYM